MKTANAFKLLYQVAWFLAVISPITASYAASFDCSKASRPLERFICNDPDFNRLDAEMGLAYRQANAAFPLRGFILATQRIFIVGYENCLKNALRQSKQLSPGSECLALLKERILELEDYGRSKVYTDARLKSWTPDDLVILIQDRGPKLRIRFWGNWMPDAYRPSPFPDGKICDLSEEVERSNNSFRLKVLDDVFIKVTETEVTVGSHIMCTPRNGIAARAYRRVR